jgi:hypothetical protein
MTRVTMGSRAGLAALAQPAAAQTHLTVMVFAGMQNLPLLAAQSQGFFDQRGLTVDIKIAPNSDEPRNGLKDGRYQIVHAAVDNAVALDEVATANAANGRGAMAAAVGRVRDDIRVPIADELAVQAKVFGAVERWPSACKTAIKPEAFGSDINASPAAP